MIKDDQIKSLLINPVVSSRNHYRADCPFCYKEQHFFIKRQTGERDTHGKNKSYSWDCKKCGESGRLFKLLNHLGQLHILDGELVNVNKKLMTSLIEEDKDVEIEDFTTKNQELPYGFSRIFDNDYLNSRGFTEFEYNKYKIGETKLVFKLKDYVIFSVEDYNQCKGYVSRSILSKAEIDEINEQSKIRGLNIKYLRYINSTTEFSKLLFGYDELNFNTDTVVLVEGIFDKIRVDQNLLLDSQDEIKCCCTFGKKVSKEQIFKLVRKRIDNIILIQDPDAIKESKKISNNLNKYFKNVLVGYTHDKDLGDANSTETANIFGNLQNPISYSTSKVNMISL